MVNFQDTFAVTVVVQRHPMFITQTADAYDLRCTYPVGSRQVSFDQISYTVQRSNEESLCFLLTVAALPGKNDVGKKY